ncbi:hypothetical protein [Treponema pedis]|nr:hypothetical protein [Treponema pedis]
MLDLLYAVFQAALAKAREINNPQNLKIFPLVYFIGRFILSNANGIA